MSSAGAGVDVADEFARALTTDTMATLDLRGDFAAVEGMRCQLAGHLTDLGADPNPANIDPAKLVDRVGGLVWAQNATCDRPLLIARRGVRAALDPEVPLDIYSTWMT